MRTPLVNYIASFAVLQDITFLQAVRFEYLRWKVHLLDIGQIGTIPCGIGCP
jgi:hypothetical protein